MADGGSAVVQVAPEEGYRLHALWMNGENITDQVNDSGVLLLDDVTKDLHLYANFAPQNSMVRYLSDIKWDSVKEGNNLLPAIDKSINQDAGGMLNAYGTVFAKGLGTHAGHEIVYKLNGAYTAFTTLAVPNAGCNAEPEKNMSIMGFVVYADDQEVFRDDHISFHDKDAVRVELDVTGVNTLKLVTTAGDNGNDWSDHLDLADAQLWYAEPDLKEIRIDGAALEEYSSTVYEYRVMADPAGPVPQVEAVTKDGVQAEVQQADSLPGKATVTVGDKVYTIFFATGDAPQLETFGLALDESTGLTGEGIVHQDGWVHVTVPEGTDVTALAPVFTVSDDAVVTVDGVEQVSGETKNDFTSPVVYRVSNANGEKEYTVQIGDWSTIPGLFADENAGKLERPSEVNYPGTLTMKLGLSWPVVGTEDSVVAARFDDALDIIRQVDNVTRGIPKVVYLVGWQYQGHDDKYPAWFEVNPRLKCTNCDHETSLDCLKWMMDEAYEKYNTRVSLHINSTDSYQDSPLWDTYVENDLISKNPDGSLMAIGTWAGETSYQVNYKNEWEKGFYKQRVDKLIDMFDGRLERAGTIHSDAFFARGSLQSNVRQEQEARVKMVRYWRDRGIDLTTEFLHNANEQNAGGSGSGMLGTIPMVWHFNQSIESYMQRPASMVTGGGINNIQFGNEKETVEILFGRSMWGEDLLTSRDTGYGLSQRPNWDKEFRYQFCTQTLPWTYQNTFDRLSLESNVVTYSDGLVANANDRTVIRDGKLIRQQDDVFVPVVWKDQNEVIAFSTNGYTEKTWQFQKEWAGGNTVDVFSVDKNGLTPVALAVDVSDGSITLSLQAGQMVSIVPSGSVEIDQPYPFNLTAPENGAVDVNPAKASLQWEASKNAVSYTVYISDSETMENAVSVDTDVCSLELADLNLNNSTVYYWKVVAQGKKGDTLENTDGVRSFTTADNTLYSVQVENGKADLSSAAEGQTVTVTADKIPGQTFQRWEGEGITFADPAAEVTTFVMPGRDVSVKAVYVPEINPTPNPTQTPKPTEEPVPVPSPDASAAPTTAPTDAPAPVLPATGDASCPLVLALLVCAACGGFLVLKRKKS